VTSFSEKRRSLNAVLRDVNDVVRSLLASDGAAKA